MSSTPWQDTRVSMVRGALNPATSNKTTIGSILAAIRDGEWAKQVEQIRVAYSTAGKDAAKPLKEKLRGFLASGTFSKRANANLIEHSGLLCCDLDECGDIDIWRTSLASDLYVAAFFASPTGSGLKVILRIQPDASLHLRSFYAAQEHFRQVYSLEIDKQCKEVARVCFVSHDPRLFMRNGDAQILEPLPEPESEPEPEKPAEESGDVELTVELKTRIRLYLEKVDPAVLGEHGSNPTYRVACVLVWGFALSFDDAKILMRFYSERCQPPWSEREIDHKLKDARKATDHRSSRGHLLGKADGESSGEPPPPPRPKQHLFADLASLWKNGLKPEVPTIARVSEELALFYAGRINEIHAEPGVGKTNVAMIAVILELLLGKDVIYLDPEDTPIGFLNRLVGLGFELTDENIARIHYLHDPSPDDINAAIKFAEANSEQISLVIYDGLAEGMAGEDLDEDKAGDVLKFLRKRLRPFAELGAAVVILDHVTKDANGRGRFSRGSGAKIGHYDGVTYSIRLVTAYSPTRAGRIELKVAKDRNGGIGPANFVVCDVVFSPNGDGTTLYEFIKPPDVAMHSPQLLKKISDWLQRNPDASGRAVRDAMHSRDEDVDNALDYLVKNGFVQLIRAETKGEAHKYRLIRPYGPAGRQAENGGREGGAS